MVRFGLVLEGVQTWGQEIGDTIKKNLIPSWVSLLMQLAAFIILLVIVVFLAYKPVKKMLKARQDYIEKEISDAEKAKAEAAVNLSQSQEAILASKKQASLILEDATAQAQRRKDEALEQARLEVEEMKRLAQEDIQRSKQEALDEIHKEMVDIALMTSSEILKREVNDEDNARLAREFIDRL